jgi:hypothetical protein
MFDFFMKKRVAEQSKRAARHTLDKQTSLEPWVQIIGDSVDPDRGIKIELDWNPAFVTYLKNSGYSGTSDEAIVQKWLAHLYKHVIEKLSDTQTNEFE